MVLPPLRRVCRPAEKGGEVETAAFRLANKMPPHSTPALCPARALGAGPGPPPAPPRSTPALCPARALGAGPGPPPAPPPTAPRLPSAPRGPWARDPVPLRRPPSTPALCPARALGAGPGPPPAPPPLHAGPLPRGPLPCAGLLHLGVIFVVTRWCCHLYTRFELSFATFTQCLN